MAQDMSGDILSRLRATEAAIWDGDDAEERRAFIKMVADEIERLQEQLDNLRAENQRLSQIAQY